MYQAAGHIHPPAHTMRARTVSDAMDNLVNLAKQVGRESPDKVSPHTAQKYVGVSRLVPSYIIIPLLLRNCVGSIEASKCSLALPAHFSIVSLPPVKQRNSGKLTACARLSKHWVE